MNIALEGTREFVDGKLRRTYGDAFVRGNNGMFFPVLSSQSMFFVFRTNDLLLEDPNSATHFSRLGPILRGDLYLIWGWTTDTFFDSIVTYISADS
jgi:hypothetical protein